MKFESMESIDAASLYRQEAARLRELARLFVYEQAELLAMAERYALLAEHAAARNENLASDGTMLERRRA
jgi:hypothetical protein